MGLGLLELDELVAVERSKSNADRHVKGQIHSHYQDGVG